MPDELVRYHYRQLFGLSSEEMHNEPVDEFFTNLFIWGQIQEKQRIENDHGRRKD